MKKLVLGIALLAAAALASAQSFRPQRFYRVGAAGISIVNSISIDGTLCDGGNCVFTGVGGGGGGTVPTGTGFVHVTAGAQDAAAKLVETGDITDASITYGKIQNVAANRLLGNATGSAAAPAEVPWNSTLEIASGNLGRAATTGDVVCPSASNACTIQANAVAIATDVSGLGTGVATFLATPSSANLAAAVTGETGTGAAVFGTAPTITSATLVSANVSDGATGPGYLDFYEDTDNGSNRVTLIGPASTANETLTLPARTDTLATLAGTESLTNKTLVQPFIEGMRFTPLVITTSQNTDPGISPYFCDATAGNVVLTLSEGIGNGRVFRMQKTDATANTCSFTRFTNDTIDGATTVAITQQWGRLGVTSYATDKWGITERWPVTDAQIDKTAIAALDVIQPASDTVDFNDSSGAVVARAKFGFLRGSRGGATCYDEMFYISSASGFWNCSIKDSRVGTGSVSVVTGTANHPGLMTCTTGADTTGTCGWQTGGTTTTATTANALAAVLLGGGRVITQVTGIGASAASDGTNTFTSYVGGFSDQVLTTVSTVPVDGVFFRYTHSVNSGNWQGVAVANSVESVCDTAFAATSAHRTFETDTNAGGTNVDFYIDGTLRCSVTSNIPTGSGRETAMLPMAIQKSAGTTGRTITLDMYAYAFDFTTAR